MIKSDLHGGCYVVTVEQQDLESHGNWHECLVISSKNGSALTQYFVRVMDGTSPISQFPGSEVILFVRSGEGNINIGGREFPLREQMGVMIKPDEAFSVSNPGSGPIEMLLTVCPACETRRWTEKMPAHFDSEYPQRTITVDPAQRQPMADRFFQLFVDENMGSRQVTQFFGEIPKSKPNSHRHLYEEAMCILEGEGYFWTADERAPVKAGDIIYLSRKQAHILQCTSDSGMTLVGLIYPQGSPAVNY